MASPSHTVNVSTENPDRHRGNALRLQDSDKVFLIIGGLLFLIVGRLTNNLGAFAFAMIILLLMRSVTYARVYGRIGQGCKNLWIRYVRKGWLVRRTRSKWSVLPGRSPINMALKRLGEFGLIGVGEHSDALPIMGQGSDFSTRELMQQFLAIQQLGELTKRLASYIKGYGIGISYVFRQRPPDLYALEHHYEDNFHPDVLLPPAQAEGKPLEQYTAYDWRCQNLRDNAVELLGLMEQVGGEPDMGMILTVRHSPAVRLPRRSKAKKANAEAKDKKVDEMPITKMAKEALRGLERSGVDSPSLLTPTGLVGFLRGAWDVHPESYQEFCASDRVTTDPDWPIQWPQHSVRVMRDHCILDGNYCGTVMFRSGPAHADPWFYRELFATEVEYPSIALVSEAVHNRTDLWAITTAINIADKITSLLQIDRLSAGARKRQQERELREEQLTDTRFRQTYHILFGVCHWDKEAFERDIENVIAVGNHLQLSPLRVSGECRQVPYFFSAATGVDFM